MMFYLSSLSTVVLCSVRVFVCVCVCVCVCVFLYFECVLFLYSAALFSVIKID